MTKKKEVFNKKELIGEKVHCLVFGNGFIESMLYGIDGSIFVRFSRLNNEIRYHYDGTRNKGENPTLSFGHKEDVEFDYGVPSVKVVDERLKTRSFGKVVLSFNNPDDGQLVYAIKSDLTIKEHGDNSIGEKKLIFKDWLDNQGINTELFWKNCKRKYNGFNKKRKLLASIYGYYFIDSAFSWDGNLLGLSYEEMSGLSTEWMDEVDAAINNNNDVQIELGF